MTDEKGYYGIKCSECNDFANRIIIPGQGNDLSYNLAKPYCGPCGRIAASDGCNYVSFDLNYNILKKLKNRNGTRIISKLLKNWENNAKNEKAKQTNKDLDIIVSSF